MVSDAVDPGGAWGADPGLAASAFARAAFGGQYDEARPLEMVMHGELATLALGVQALPREVEDGTV